MAMSRTRARRARRAKWPQVALRRSLAVLAVVALVAVGCSSDDDPAAPDGTGSDGAGGEAGPGDEAGAGGVSRADVEASLASIDGIVEAAMDETGVPGVAVAVVYDDEVVFTEGYGVTSTETDEPVEPETVFQIASMSKPVSSTVVAGVVGDGTIAWDEPIAEVAPDLELSDAWVADHVTFADLFAHRSGLPGAVAGNDLETVRYDRATILERLRHVPLDPFRITYSYSNFGMTLGGVAAAMAAGTTWEELAEEVLFEPAGMTSTSMRHEDYLAHDDRALLHVEHDGEWVPDFERQPDGQAPAGGVSSNVVDLARWLRLQLAGGSLDGEQIIDEDALDLTHTPQVMKTPPSPTIGDHAGFYGLGWNIETDATGAIRWNHSGAFSLGAATVVKALPDAGLGIIVLTNGWPIGLPEAITDAYLELVQTGEVATDWVPLWQERFSGIFGPPQDWTTPPEDAAPAQPDEVYVGTYANDYVGEVRVEATAEGLELVVGPESMAFALEHWDGDTFVYVDAPELPEQRVTATFTVEDGVAVALNLSAFDGAGLGDLPRT